MCDGECGGPRGRQLGLPQPSLTKAGQLVPACWLGHVLSRQVVVVTALLADLNQCCAGGFRCVVGRGELGHAQLPRVATCPNVQMWRPTRARATIGLTR
ncbi:hypothetical protein E2C01_035418 [Portunus trituberculatus]|uniref:Uncharacterized protein n=1 Tax=Portunus trituberculatus TaxID=210409 RepID=A0A5B7F5N1_PORTR|nr:hypothetical protein [Portunus trituberculatus]